MLTIAYLANEFPSPVEPYMAEEIVELERRGVRVVKCSAIESRRGRAAEEGQIADIVLLPLGISVAWQAAWLCIWQWASLIPMISRALFRGDEGPVQRLKALVHTFLGACYAIELRELGVQHIHVHHGYFGSWITMTAARLLGIGYSLTLHGSDLLLNASYLDEKLAACKFCATVSEYNRRYIHAHYSVAQEKVNVNRLGVEVPEHFSFQA